MSPMMVPATTGPTPKTSVRVVREALTAAASFFLVSRSWSSRWRRPARNSAASSARASSTAPDGLARSRSWRPEPRRSPSGGARDQAGARRGADAGLHSLGRRRVPGLRREEVAPLAGISPEYYLRLERGRGPATDSEWPTMSLTCFVRL